MSSKYLFSSTVFRDKQLLEMQCVWHTSYCAHVRATAPASGEAGVHRGFQPTQQPSAMLGGIANRRHCRQDITWNDGWTWKFGRWRLFHAEQGANSSHVTRCNQSTESSRKSQLIGVCREKMPKFSIVSKTEQILLFS